jgi:ferredoxin
MECCILQVKAIFPTYEGGAQWSLNGENHKPITNNYFYIVPDKCTECVGFHDEPQCVAVCQVDCIIKYPDNVESNEELLAKKEKLDKMVR